MDRHKRLLDCYDMFPFHHHPLWMAVKGHELSVEQVLRAELQHYVRTKAGQALRRAAVEEAQAVSPVIWEALFQTYLEECVTREGNVSHLELIERLLKTAGLGDSDFEGARPTPGNSAAIALYRDISARGAGCHMLGAGAVEHYYADLCPAILEAYTQHYGMSEEQAETYSLHGPMDKEHASRAFDILDEAERLHGWDAIEQSVRDAFVATSLHYDGMLQAATGQRSYWDGVIR